MKISTCFVLLAISLTSTVAASPLATNSGLHRRVIPEQVTAQASGQKAWAALEKKLKDKTPDVDALAHYQKLYHVDYLKVSTAEVGEGVDGTTMVSQTPLKRGPPANAGAAAIYAKLHTIFPGISIEKDYNLVALSSMPRGTKNHPTPPPFKFNSVEIAYENYYDAKNGVIVAASNYQKVDKNIKPPPAKPKITLSSLFYYTYQAAAKREAKDVKNLKYMVRWEVKSKQTMPILTEIHKGKPAGTWLVWTHQSTPTTFLQLVGSDNGRSVAFMLADFSQAFGEKTICAVLTNPQLKVMVWVFSTGTPSKCPAAYQNDPAKGIQLGVDPPKRKASTSPPRSPGSNPQKKPSSSRPGSPAPPNQKKSPSRPGSPAP